MSKLTSDTQMFLAPAKINLCLHVLGKRPNGYHEVAMLMQQVSLFDRIDISLREAPGVTVVCDGLELAPGEENIAGRAANLLLESCGRKVGVMIDIEKRIPVAAGLGGGSSDAAAVLMGLNEMLGLGVSRSDLMQLGVQLGADVPFFIFDKAAWATGIGEVLEKVAKLPSVWYVLVNPGVAVSTAWVYQNLGLTSQIVGYNMPELSGTAESLEGIMHNDLERVTVPAYPVVDEVKLRLIEEGAIAALMSGSGPTVFGVFRTEYEAQAAADSLGGQSGWRAFVVQPC